MTSWDAFVGQNTNQHTTVGDMRSSEGRFDLLSDALRDALSRLPSLRNLDISGCFDASLFLPLHVHSEKELEDVPCWPSLENLAVLFEGRRPDGGTYFAMRPNGPRDDALLAERVLRARLADAMPPGYHHHGQYQHDETKTQLPEDQDKILRRQAFRQAETASFTVPKLYSRHDRIFAPERSPVTADYDDSLSSLLSSFARACNGVTSMPKLQKAELRSWIPGHATSEDGSETQRAARLWGVW
ncbi:hypothetical protein Micbo1qcDRAFT_167457 [Microdochium bolleyi]|uniref:Uncharacterized protein n=1 Tax=Microdochium bolleyi TaxID=196109 RepID=A0A136IR89_9PEZI|nr:hypothetical protein Micbo1qcDRAFT_167457 [Microdochium bolleyi]